MIILIAANDFIFKTVLSPSGSKIQTTKSLKGKLLIEVYLVEKGESMAKPPRVGEEEGEGEKL